MSYLRGWSREARDAQPDDKFDYTGTVRPHPIWGGSLTHDDFAVLALLFGFGSVGDCVQFARDQEAKR